MGLRVREGEVGNGGIYGRFCAFRSFDFCVREPVVVLFLYHSSFRVPFSTDAVLVQNKREAYLMIQAVRPDPVIYC